MTAPTHALTLWRPWPWAIFHAPTDEQKCVENRQWMPPAWHIGTRIAIHAGKKWDEDAVDLIEDEAGPMPVLSGERSLHEGIIGTALLVGVVEGLTEWPYMDGSHGRRLVAGAMGSVTNDAVDPWFIGRYGWLLDDRRALPEPIPCRGAQGLWRLPDDVAARLA